MNAGYDFHPGAEVDFTDIWDFIAEDSSACGPSMKMKIDSAPTRKRQRPSSPPLAGPVFQRCPWACGQGSFFLL